MISHLNAKLINGEQHAFRDPQLEHILVTFLFTSNTHFQDRQTHFYGTFAFSDVFLTRLYIFYTYNLNLYASIACFAFANSLKKAI